MEYVRINVSLASEDLKYLRRLEAATGKSRSELIRDAVRAYQPPRSRRMEPEQILRMLDTVRIGLPKDPVTMIRAIREGQREW